MKCPSCGKEVDSKENPHRPFCSERCKLIDLGRWVNEEYRVPGREVPEHSGDEDDGGKQDQND